jgi:uncharacterized protein YegP (UPF0339 family)
VEGDTHGRVRDHQGRPRRVPVAAEVRNGQIIATSGEGYTAKASAENGIEAVKRDAPGAKIDDQTD